VGTKTTAKHGTSGTDEHWSWFQKIKKGKVKSQKAQMPGSLNELSRQPRAAKSFSGGARLASGEAA